VTGRHSRAPVRARLLARASAGSTGPGRSRPVRPPRPGRLALPAQSLLPQSLAAPVRPAPAEPPQRQAEAIFRAEALESHARGAEVPEVALRLGARWLQWLYLLCLGLVAAGVAVTLTARTPQESFGSAVVTEPGGHFAALLPAAAVPDLTHRGGNVAIELGVSPRPVRVTITQLRLATPQLAARAGLASPAQLSVLLTGELASGSGVRPGEVHTSMTLVVGSQTVGSVLLGELEVMFGNSGAG
jgi:hypothetical protein